MPKLETTTTTTVTQKLTLKLEPRVQQMLAARVEEHAQIEREIKARKARQDRIKAEVDELFTKAGEGAALLDGTDINGHKVKMVCGMSARLNKQRLIELGCEPEWLAEATEETPNQPYIKITAPRAGKDNGE